MTPPDISLKDKVAVVTGGGGGLGRAIALSYAQAGACLVVADIVPERCDEVAGRIAEMGGKALVLPCDVTQDDQVQMMVERAVSEFGRIDILVNNVGGVVPKAFSEQSRTAWRRIVDLNFFSMLYATSAVIPHMIDGGRGGAIVNVSSIEGSRAAPNFSTLR